MDKQLTQEKIIYFDGVCNLCNAFIDFIVTQDRQRKFKIASLQGETAQKRLPKEYIEKLDSIVYQREGKLYRESHAALWIISDLGGLYVLLRIFTLIPTGVRDFIYRQIAKNRYRWFGKKQTCRIPTPEEKEYFLP